MGLMNLNQATVIANNTAEGISVIGVDIYVHSKHVHFFASKNFIDDVNSIPFLDREEIKNAISKKFGIPKTNITFPE